MKSPLIKILFLAVKKGIDVLAGVVDSTYRGEIMAVLINLGNDPVAINKGDKIAQIIFERCEPGEFNVVDDLDETTRNEKGFGSSDKQVIDGLKNLPGIETKVDKSLIQG